MIEIQPYSPFFMNKQQLIIAEKVKRTHPNLKFLVPLEQALMGLECPLDAGFAKCKDHTRMEGSCNCPICLREVCITCVHLGFENSILPNSIGINSVCKKDPDRFSHWSNIIREFRFNSDL